MKHRLKLGTLLSLLLVIWLATICLRLLMALSSPTEAYFVLGGSNTREVKAAELVKSHPAIPTLISSGIAEPCIWNIFQRAKAPMTRVFLETCAQSTFENFYFGLPILENWHVKKVTVITSKSHCPRAKWLSQIILGSHGIWTDFAIIDDGIPAKPESEGKTWLDVTRAFAWAILSQFYWPKCHQVKPLATVDMTYWNQVGYHCPHHTNPITGQIENDSVIPKNAK